jgi:hypothetical protein
MRFIDGLSQGALSRCEIQNSTAMLEVLTGPHCLYHSQ